MAPGAGSPPPNPQGDFIRRRDAMKILRSACFLPALLLPLLLTACGPSGGDAGRARLVVYSPHGPEILGEMKARFEAAHPDVEMRWQYLSLTDILTKPILAAMVT